MTTQPLYRTDDLPFSAFLCAARKLKFLGCEAASSYDRRVEFLFEDPEGIGDKLYLDFNQGAQCEAAAFYDQVRHLRKLIDRTKFRSQEHDHSHRR